MKISRDEERSKHVYLVSDNLGGGLGAAVSHEAEYFARQAWSVTILTPNAEDESRKSPDLVDLGIEFADIEMPKATRQVLQGLRAGRAVVNLASTAGASTVIHCHGLRSSLFVRLARPRVPMAMTYHGGTVYSRSRRLVMSCLASSCDLAISASPFPPRRFIYWPHASPLLQGLPMDPRAASSDDVIRVGWFGRLDPPKRPDLWLAALKEARISGVEVSGHVVGDGSLLESFRKQACKMDFSVTLYGALPAREALQTMDVLLTWSDSDALAFTVQEAVWFGIPALTNNIPGPSSILGQCDIGVIDKDSIVVALRELRDPVVRLATVRSQQAALLNVLRPGDPLPKIYSALKDLLTGV